MPDAAGLDAFGDFTLAWSPQGDRVAFPATQLHGRRELWMWFLDCPTDLDLCLLPVTAIGQVRGRPAWSSDGKWVTFVSQSGGDEEIYAVKVPDFWSPVIRAREAIRLTTSSGRDYDPAWRP